MRTGGISQQWGELERILHVPLMYDEAIPFRDQIDPTVPKHQQVEEAFDLLLHIRRSRLLCLAMALFHVKHGPADKPG